MFLIKLAMGRPITIMVLVMAFLFTSAIAMTKMKVDIFPNLNLPVIYVVQPYGGMDPAQMEAFIVSHYETHFLYISGVDHIESRSIQNIALMKIVFQPDVDMAEAMSSVVAQVDRSKSKMPPGTVTPFILRFDAGNVPVGYVVLTSTTKGVGEIQALADERVRPILSTIPGVTTPHAFGGNVRTIVVTIDPQRLRSLQMGADEVVAAVSTGNLISPSGILRTGNLQRIASLNSTVVDIQELAKIPLRRSGAGAVYLGDVATIEDGMDIATGWALVNGRRTVYLAVAKLAEASTTTVVKRVRDALPKMRSVIPADIKVNFEFDQSIYVTEAVNGLIFESAIGAALTGLMVLLFLRDFRSAIVVVATIPIALAAAVVGLWAVGQSINIMTLSGLSLAVGVLVDEATVAIENIHTHLERGVPLFKGIIDACREVITPQLLAVLSVVSVFIPSFFMEGTTGALFVPLSLAVGFAMAASYVLSNTLVPVMCGWLLKAQKTSDHNDHGKLTGPMAKLRRAYARTLIRLQRLRAWILAGYCVLVVIVLLIAVPNLKTEIFPTGNPSSFQVRLRATPGTRIELTEDYTQKALKVIAEDVGLENIDVSMCYVGTQPPNYASSTLYIWTSGPQEALMLVSLKHGSHINISDLQERLRKQLKRVVPEVAVTFESGDIVNKIMNLGASTPIQVDVEGAHLGEDEEVAKKILAEMAKVPELRDVSITQPLSYPTVDVTVDRVRAGDLGVTTADVSKALVPAVYSSRFLKQIWWRDTHHGHSYQVQVQYPQSKMDSLKDLETVPLDAGNLSGPSIRDVAQVNFGTMTGEYDRYNLRRQVTITANLFGDDLGKAASKVEAAIARVGELPRGMTVSIRGQVPMLYNTFAGLSIGLGLAVLVIFLMLVAYFQTFRLPLIVLCIVPSILAGVALTILLTGVTMNVQSFMGAIMAIGIGVANAILILAFSEKRRIAGSAASAAGIRGAVSRLRPVLMTSLAMIAGMAPMALGLAEGGERTAPLGIAVIGGLTASLMSVLLIVPLLFALFQRNASVTVPNMLYDESEKSNG